MAGPIVRQGAQIGVNVTLLPYVTIGRGAIIGAGSVVTRDVPDGMIAYGNPAVAVRSVPDTRSVATRIGRARAGRFERPNSGGRP
jgi:acetyltransferase-like isoleucine patch superfamily enzyme